jgi:U3 small nucleolar RNA-associated protein 13
LKSLEKEKLFTGYNDEIVDLKYLNGGSHVVVATNSEDIRIYNIRDNSCEILVGHENTVICLDVSSKVQNWLVSGSKDHSVRLWDTKSCK